MCEYYARLFREVGRRVFVFWKAQIIVGIGAGIATVALNAIRQQTPTAVAVWSIAIAILGYLCILAVFSICATMCAPVNLDQQRVQETATVERRRVLEVSERDKRISEQQSTIVKQNEIIARRHPHDEHLERQIAATLDGLTQKERDFVSWLLDVGEARNATVFNAGYGQIPDEVMRKAHGLVGYQSIRPGNGMIEMDRIYRITSERAVDALRKVLHPPPRPVTAPQA